MALRLRGDGDLVGAEQAVIAEMDRLEDLLSVFRSESEWSRWRRGEVSTPGIEIVALLDLGARWHQRSGGAFHPSVGVLRARWMQAVEEQRVPSRDEMQAIANTIRSLPYRVEATDGPTVERLGDCSLLDLHALAKGWIVDRGLAMLATFDGIDDALLDAGGDLRHVGTAPITVGVEDPRRPFDNVAPFERVRVTDAAVASSSGSRRPHVIAGRRFTHVLDPRTGWPIEHILAATVIAPTAADADAVATVVGVLPVADGLAFVDSLGADDDRFAALLMDADGGVHRSARWPD